MINEQKQGELIHQMLNDLGGAFGIGLVRIGKSVGLYDALADGEAVTSEQLAARTGLNERYVREWLGYHAASHYLAYDPAARTFTMEPEQVAVLGDPESPFYIADAFESAAACVENAEMVKHAFRHGGGVGWGNQSGCMFCAVARFFRPGYRSHLVESWLPALDGMVEKLEKGARVADVGCGHGYSTVMMAEAFPNSEFVGFDFHKESVDEARQHAKAHNGTGNISFEVATAKSFPGSDYDLITCFDCLHDLGDPAGAAKHIHRALRPGGSWMIAEPFAHDTLEENINPVGRLYYAASTVICVPTSMDQEVATALGAQAGEKKLREVITSGGFDTVRRVTETPFNLVLEAAR